MFRNVSINNCRNVTVGNSTDVSGNTQRSLSEKVVTIDGGENFADNLAKSIKENKGSSGFKKIIVHDDIPGGAQFEIKFGEIEVEGNVLSGHKSQETRVKTKNGNITVKGKVDDYAKVGTGSGNVTVTQDVGKALVKTKNGNINVSGSIAGKALVKTENGNITVAGSVGDGSKIQVTNGNATIEQSVGNNVVFEISNGHLKIAGSVGDGSKFKATNSKITFTIGGAEFKREVKGKDAVFNVKNGTLLEDVREAINVKQPSTRSVQLLVNGTATTSPPHYSTTSTSTSRLPGTNTFEIAGVSGLHIGQTHVYEK